MADKKNIIIKNNKKTRKKIKNPYLTKSNRKSKYVGGNKSKDDIERDVEAPDRDDKPMSIVGHLAEFRSRLIKSLITITVVTIGSFFFFSEYIIDIINKPYLKTGLKLNVFTLSEGFMLKAKASLIAGIFAGIPVIVYEIWKYIKPAISKNDRKFIGRSIIASVFLLYTGVILTYFFLLPIAIKMLLNFTPIDMNTMIQASKYLNFALLFGIAMGALCELPVIIMILTKIGIITPVVLIKKRKYAIIIIWILAGILTPGPDILSQSLVAIPVMLLYEISIIISKIMIKRKLKQNY